MQAWMTGAIVAERPEEFLAERLTIDAEIFLDRDIPGPPEFRFRVPAVDQNAVDIEEDLHDWLSSFARDIGRLDISAQQACTWRLRGEEGVMAKTNFKSVDEYIATQPETVQPILERVRGTIRKAVPRAEEVISYQIPAYKMNGGAVLYFAGWKQHYSLYPASDRLVKAFKGDLARYTVSKGTIRFPWISPSRQS
jgi:uncharacterized protein YdhG (YjbR/CyaY superfamily)